MQPEIGIGAENTQQQTPGGSPDRTPTCHAGF